MWCAAWLLQIKHHVVCPLPGLLYYYAVCPSIIFMWQIKYKKMLWTTGKVKNFNKNLHTVYKVNITVDFWVSVWPHGVLFLVGRPHIKFSCSPGFASKDWKSKRRIGKIYIEFANLTNTWPLAYPTYTWPVANLTYIWPLAYPTSSWPVANLTYTWPLAYPTYTWPVANLTFAWPLTYPTFTWPVANLTYTRPLAYPTYTWPVASG